MQSIESPETVGFAAEDGALLTWPNEGAPFVNELTAEDLDGGMDEPLGPVLLAVHGPVCSESQMMLDSMVAFSWLYRRHAHFAVLDLRAVPEAALRLGITEVPSLLLFNVSEALQRWSWQGADSLRARLVPLMDSSDRDARSALEALGVRATAGPILITNGD